MTTPSFHALGVPAPIADELAAAGIETPFEIQAAVVPDGLAGRDVVGRAPTGAGKTLAFGIPVIARLAQGSSGHPAGLILAPTRELAEQIATELAPLAKAMGRRVVSVYGGVGYARQLDAIKRGVDLVVACPGRLEDLLAMEAVSLDAVDVVVVDEADRMADMGFLPAVRRLVSLTKPGRQTLLFSATLDGAVGKLAAEVQSDPVRHEVGADGPDLSTAEHYFWRCTPDQRLELTAEVAERLGSIMVFCRTRHGSDRIARQLERHGIRATAIHGGRSQNQRDRALRDFTQGRAQALVATDVAARGVHVDAVAGVVHFDPPEDGTTYIHRSGRTARAGASGVVVSLWCPGSDRAFKSMRREADISGELVPADVAVLGEPKPRAQRSNDDGRDGSPRSDRDRSEGRDRGDSRGRGRDDRDNRSRDDRDNRGRGDRPDRGRFERSDSRGDRDNRGRDRDGRDGRGRDDRPAARGDRFESRGRNDRPGSFGRDDRRDGAPRGDRFGSGPRRDAPARDRGAGRDRAPGRERYGNDRAAGPSRRDDAAPARNGGGDHGGRVESGTVLSYNEDRGFGFIDVGADRDLFVHHSNLSGRIRPGQRVTFSVREGRRGPEAVGVRKA